MLVLIHMSTVGCLAASRSWDEIVAIGRGGPISPLKPIARDLGEDIIALLQEEAGQPCLSIVVAEWNDAGERLTVEYCFQHAFRNVTQKRDPMTNKPRKNAVHAVLGRHDVGTTAYYWDTITSAFVVVFYGGDACVYASSVLSNPNLSDLEQVADSGTVTYQTTAAFRCAEGTETDNAAVPLSEPGILPRQLGGPVSRNQYHAHITTCSASFVALSRVVCALQPDRTE